MPSFTTSVALLALSAAGALAVPYQKRTNDEYSNCMSFADADQVATLYGQLISNYTTELADAILAPTFIDYSESVNTLINSCPQGDAAVTLPLMDPTFSNRAQFERGQGQQPLINFQQLKIWPACNTVIIRWLTTNTANATETFTNIKPVAGLIVMETSPAPEGNAYPRRIETVYSEFDAGAWLQNLQDAGICGPVPAASAAPAAAPSPNVGGAIASGLGAAASTPAVTPTAVIVTETAGTTVVAYETQVVTVTA